MKNIQLAKSENSLKILKDWNNKAEENLNFPFTKQTIATSYGDTNVLITGPDSDEPPILLLHGALSGAAFAMGELSDLPKKRKFIAVNIPGQSTETAEVRLEFGTEEYSNWLCDLLDSLGLDQACLVGISWGGSVAIELAKHQAERIHSMLLVVQAALVKAPVLDGIFKLALPMLRYKLFPSVENRDKAFQHIFTTTDPFWSPYIADAQKHYTIDFSAPPLATKGQLTGFNKPTYIIAAENDIQFPGDKLLEKAQQVFPNYIGGYILPNSNHCPSFKDEDRKEFERIFEQGLEQLNHGEKL